MPKRITRFFAGPVEGQVVVLLSDSGMDVFAAAHVDQRRHVFTADEARALATALVEAADDIKAKKP